MFIESDSFHESALALLLQVNFRAWDIWTKAHIQKAIKIPRLKAGTRDWVNKTRELIRTIDVKIFSNL